MSAEKGTLTLEQINRMSREQFVAALGGIFEHSPWVAERAYQQIPFPFSGGVAPCNAANGAKCA